MFRQEPIESHSEEELDNIDLPHIKACDKYLEEVIVPDFVAFYIANGYQHSALWESSYLKHFHSAADSFNLDIQDERKALDNVTKILKIKYSLEVVEECPILKVKEI